jgi:SAM-dependent methyltransferase
MLSRAMSFDSVAQSYDQARPRYPEALFDDLLKIARLPLNARILDVGAGSGIATLPFAARGFDVVALEPGAELAKLARRNLVAYPNATVHRVSFEKARLATASFDMILSATAWHWVDPLLGSTIAARVLPPGGTLALWWMGFSTLTDHFVAQSREIIRSWVSSPVAAANGALWTYRGTPRGPGSSVSSCLVGDIDAHPDFLKINQRRYITTQSYNASTYVQLLGTYADFVLLPEPLRSGLYADIGRLINERFSGTVTRTFVTTLYVWRRLKHAQRRQAMCAKSATQQSTLKSRIGVRS